MTEYGPNVSRRTVLKKGALVTGGLVVGGMATGTAAAGIGEGRVGHYHLNSIEDDGTVHDASPQNNHGTWTGDDDPVGKGKVGNGFQLEDEGDYINVEDGISISAGSDVTFAAWLNVEEWHGTNPGGWRSSDNSRGSNAHFNIFQGNTGLPWIRWNGNEILRPDDGYNVTPGQGWVHVAYVVRSEENAEFYADGEMRHDSEHSASTGDFDIYNIGWQYGKGQRIEGIYDEVRFYDRALSESEIQSLATMGGNSGGNNGRGNGNRKAN